MTTTLIRSRQRTNGDVHCQQKEEVHLPSRETDNSKLMSGSRRTPKADRDPLKGLCRAKLSTPDRDPMLELGSAAVSMCPHMNYVLCLTPETDGR